MCRLFNFVLKTNKTTEIVPDLCPSDFDLGDVLVWVDILEILEVDKMTTSINLFYYNGDIITFNNNKLVKESL